MRVLYKMPITCNLVISCTIPPRFPIRFFDCVTSRFGRIPNSFVFIRIMKHAHSARSINCNTCAFSLGDGERICAKIKAILDSVLFEWSKHFLLHCLTNFHRRFLAFSHGCAKRKTPRASDSRLKKSSEPTGYIQKTFFNRYRTISDFVPDLFRVIVDC